MPLLVLKAYAQLIRFGRYLAEGDFVALRQIVSATPFGKPGNDPALADRICRAVDVACICYCSEVLCLQRAAATTCLLRAYGVRAEMVIGAQLTPAKAHAWVEVDGRVVNDRPYLHQIYAILDKC